MMKILFIVIGFNFCFSQNQAYIDSSKEYIKLRAISDIKSGEELTAYYWLYNVS